MIKLSLPVMLKRYPAPGRAEDLGHPCRRPRTSTAADGPPGSIPLPWKWNGARVVGPIRTSVFGEEASCVEATNVGASSCAATRLVESGVRRQRAASRDVAYRTRTGFPRCAFAAWRDPPSALGVVPQQCLSHQEMSLLRAPPGQPDG